MGPVEEEKPCSDSVTQDEGQETANEGKAIHVQAVISKHVPPERQKLRCLSWTSLFRSEGLRESTRPMVSARPLGALVLTEVARELASFLGRSGRGTLGGRIRSILLGRCGLFRLSDFLASFGHRHFLYACPTSSQRTTAIVVASCFDRQEFQVNGPVSAPRRLE